MCYLLGMKLFKKLIPVFALCSAFLSSACTDLKLFAVNAPIDLEAEQIQSDLIFDSTNDLALDLYFPKERQPNQPLLVFFYGGSWQDGKKEEYKFIAAHFVKRGFVVAVPDYRKHPDVTFPDFVNDNVSALKWLYDNAAQYNIDRSQTVLMGHSAGAFNAALLAYDDQYLKNKGMKKQNIKAFIGLSGPYAFIPQAEDIKAVFAPPTNYPAMQIPDFVDAGDPMALLIHGAQDKIVRRSNLDKFERALKSNDVPSTVFVYDGLDHAGTVAALTWVKKDKSKLVDDIDAFLEKAGF